MLVKLDGNCTTQNNEIDVNNVFKVFIKKTSVGMIVIFDLILSATNNYKISSACKL